MTQDEYEKISAALDAFIDIAKAASLRQIELASTPSELNDARAAALGRDSPIKQVEKALWSVCK